MLLFRWYITHNDPLCQMALILAEQEPFRRLADLLATILHQVGRMEQDFSKDEASDHRPFRFATGATALIYRLGTALRLLRRRFPQTEILVTVAATEARRCTR